MADPRQIMIMVCCRFHGVKSTQSNIYLNSKIILKNDEVRGVLQSSDFLRYTVYATGGTRRLRRAQKKSTPVLNYSPFDFFDFKLDHSFYLKIYTKYHFFSRGLLYQYKIFKNNLNLTIFTKVFE